MERGKFSSDDLGLDRADTWCVANLLRSAGPAAPCTSASGGGGSFDDCSLRWRATARTALLGKGSKAPGRAGGAGQHRGLPPPGSCGSLGCGVGLVRGGSALGPVARGGGRGGADLGAAKRRSPGSSRSDAGIATQKQFAAATARDALTGRLRINCKLRGALLAPPAEPARAAAHARGGFASRGGPARSGAGRGCFTRPGEKGEVAGAAQHLAF